MKEDNMEFLINDKKLKKAYRKAKLLSTVRTIVIVILVIIPMYIAFIKINTRITYKIGTEYYNEIRKILEVTKPNAYVSKADDIIGIFGASGQYTVSKVVGSKPIDLHDEISRYGLVGSMEPNRVIMSEGRGGYHNAGEWPVNINKSGNLLMMAFHPDIQYKEYKNDLALLNKISQDSLLEMTLSFDKKYKASEIAEILPEANISEILIDGYSEDEMNKYKKEAKEYDGKATYIPEFYFVRFAVDRGLKYAAAGEISEKYMNFLDDLQFDYKYNQQYKGRFMTIYSTLKAKDQLQGNKVDIIGAVVYGTPEELQKLMSNHHIKASSAGIVIKDIVFK
jgi:hypothetical protein